MAESPEFAAENGSADGGYPGLGQVLVVVPTYNEAENIRLIAERLRAAVPEAYLLVADDASPDGTGAVADELAESDKHVRVLHRPGKAGLGAAYIAGFRYAADAGYDVVVEMDADGSHAPEELPRLLNALRTADLVIGSRWVPGGAVLNWPWHRKVISLGGNLYTRIALGVRLKDATAGFRAYRMSGLAKLDLTAVASQGYCFQVDMAWQTRLAGLRIVEVPITFAERERGKSKMSSAILLEALWRVTGWGARARLRGLANLFGRRAG